MKVNFTLITLLFAFSTMLTAQIAPDKYYVQFTDKNNSPYSIDQPDEFLSQRALDRRAKYDISISEEDLPVNPQYLQGVADLGVQILNPTKWMNGVTVFCDNPAIMDLVLDLPYVQSTVKLPDNHDGGKVKSFFANESVVKAPDMGSTNFKSTRSMDYGGAGPQINQIDGIVLHDMGYQGQGMVIAVLDAGYEGADVHPFFDSLRMNNRLLGTRDFVHPGTNNVYNESGHGKSVLSIMAAFSPGQMIGTAPRASYWLFRTEYVPTENVIEEYNWVSAAELADSVGADVINCSLGYITFDDTTFNHTYEDMDGMTNVSTRGADKAVEKGIMVVNSAGNSGGDPFPYIGAPADGFRVLTIGAVDWDGVRALFSSIGPTYDGRHKPTIAATGDSTFVAYGSSGAGHGDGTSFSSPIIAGMTACLMQAYPEMTVAEVQDALKQSGNQASNPDDLLGWGIPDYVTAYGLLLDIAGHPDQGKALVEARPNPCKDQLTLKLTLDSIEQVVVNLVNTSGDIMFSGNYTRSRADNKINLNQQISNLASGVYFVKVVTPTRTGVVKIFRE
ncbi:MAG: S8 family serine peptidase [Bacteroidales bacterium]|nr:S8 family serine peptidase [Bacteroidales bacterium]